MKPNESAVPAAPGQPDASRDRTHVIESNEILRGKAEVLIRHNGREYRLRNTRLGKLILTA